VFLKTKGGFQNFQMYIRLIQNISLMSMLISMAVLWQLQWCSVSPSTFLLAYVS